ncbi:MAG: hypothetical protein ABS938_02905, partial [Psychrobacillus psychrodurans]
WTIILKSGRGRKEIKYDESILISILDQYVKETNTKSPLKYKAILEFSNEKIEEGELPEILKLFKESFWRTPGKQGRTLIDSYNEKFFNYSLRDDKVDFDLLKVVQKILNTDDNNEVERLLKGIIAYRNKFEKLNLQNIKLVNRIEELNILIEKKNRKLDFLENILFSLKASNLKNRSDLLNNFQMNYLENIDDYLNNRMEIENLEQELVNLNKPQITNKSKLSELINDFEKSDENIDTGK